MKSRAQLAVMLLDRQDSSLSASFPTCGRQCYISLEFDSAPQNTLQEILNIRIRIRNTFCRRIGLCYSCCYSRIYMYLMHCMGQCDEVWVLYELNKD